MPRPPWNRMRFPRAENRQRPSSLGERAKRRVRTTKCGCSWLQVVIVASLATSSPSSLVSSRSVRIRRGEAFPSVSRAYDSSISSAQAVARGRST